MCESILSNIRGTVYYELPVLEISRADCNCQQNLNFFQHVNVTIALSSEEQLIHCSAVDNFLWMVYSTHHVCEIWCTQKPECVPV